MKQLVECFARTLAINEEQVTLALAYQSIPQWDSVAHMALIADIENTFNITLDVDEIIGMSDVAKAVAILRKHGVQIDVAG